MPGTPARRALFVGCVAVLVLLAIIAAVPGSRHDSTGAAPTGAAAPAGPSWEQLMGQSVQVRKAGEIREAEILLERATSLSETFDVHDMRRAHTRMGLAEFHLWNGQTELAEREYKEAVTIGAAAGGADHPEMIRLLEGLANFYAHRQRYDDAVPILTRILEIVRSARPRDPHEEARRLRSLAQVQQLRRHHSEALLLSMEAVRAVETSPDRSSDEIAEYLQAAAESYLTAGRARTAKPVAARALALMESLTGPESLAVVPYLKTLAEASMGSDDSRRAADLYRRAIIIVERTSGATHTDLEPFLSGLSSALRAQGQLREADRVLARARRISADASRPRESFPVQDDGSTAPTTNR